MAQLTPQLVIFDFDRTLAEHHLYHMLAQQRRTIHQLSDDELLSVFGGAERYRALASFLHRLSKQGLFLIVVSAGTGATVNAALSRAGFRQYFREVYCWDSPELQAVQGVKVRLIRRLEENLGLKPEQVVFCDDDAANIEAEVTLGSGDTVTAACFCRTVGPSQGLTAGLTVPMMNSILQWAGCDLINAPS